MWAIILVESHPEHTETLCPHMKIHYSHVQDGLYIGFKDKVREKPIHIGRTCLC